MNEKIERYDGLAECKTYCNEGQIMPAMVYYVEECGLPIRAGSRCVERDTGGMVTASRADKVYRDRKGATNVADKRTPDRDLGPETDLIKIFKKLKATCKYIEVNGPVVDNLNLSETAYKGWPADNGPSESFDDKAKVAWGCLALLWQGFQCRSPLR